MGCNNSKEVKPLEEVVQVKTVGSDVTSQTLEPSLNTVGTSVTVETSDAALGTSCEEKFDTVAEAPELQRETNPPTTEEELGEYTENKSLITSADFNTSADAYTSTSVKTSTNAYTSTSVNTAVNTHQQECEPQPTEVDKESGQGSNESRNRPREEGVMPPIQKFYSAVVPPTEYEGRGRYNTGEGSVTVPGGEGWEESHSASRPVNQYYYCGSYSETPRLYYSNRGNYNGDGSVIPIGSSSSSPLVHSDQTGRGSVCLDSRVPCAMQYSAAAGRRRKALNAVLSRPGMSCELYPCFTDGALYKVIYKRGEVVQIEEETTTTSLNGDGRAAVVERRRTGGLSGIGKKDGFSEALLALDSSAYNVQCWAYFNDTEELEYEVQIRFTGPGIVMRAFDEEEQEVKVVFLEGEEQYRSQRGSQRSVNNTPPRVTGYVSPDSYRSTGGAYSSTGSGAGLSPRRYASSAAAAASASAAAIVPEDDPRNYVISAVIYPGQTTRVVEVAFPATDEADLSRMYAEEIIARPLSEGYFVKKSEESLDIVRKELELMTVVTARHARVNWREGGKKEAAVVEQLRLHSSATTPGRAWDSLAAAATISNAGAPMGTTPRSKRSVTGELGPGTTGCHSTKALTPRSPCRGVSTARSTLSAAKRTIKNVADSHFDPNSSTEGGINGGGGSDSSLPELRFTDEEVIDACINNGALFVDRQFLPTLQNDYLGTAIPVEGLETELSQPILCWLRPNRFLNHLARRNLKLFSDVPGNVGGGAIVNPNGYSLCPDDVGLAMHGHRALDPATLSVVSQWRLVLSTIKWAVSALPDIWNTSAFTTVCSAAGPLESRLPHGGHGAAVISGDGSAATNKHTTTRTTTIKRPDGSTTTRTTTTVTKTETTAPEGSEATALSSADLAILKEVTTGEIAAAKSAAFAAISTISAYRVTLYDPSKKHWTSVLIDDILPVWLLNRSESAFGNVTLTSRMPFYAASATDPTILWVPLLIKAMAKLCGSYWAIVGDVKTVTVTQDPYNTDRSLPPGYYGEENYHNVGRLCPRNEVVKRTVELLTGRTVRDASDQWNVATVRKAQLDGSMVVLIGTALHQHPSLPPQIPAESLLTEAETFDVVATFADVPIPSQDPESAAAANNEFVDPETAEPLYNLQLYTVPQCVMTSAGNTIPPRRTTPFMTVSMTWSEIVRRFSGCIVIKKA